MVRHKFVNTTGDTLAGSSYKTLTRWLALIATPPEKQGGVRDRLDKGCLWIVEDEFEWEE